MSRLQDLLRVVQALYAKESASFQNILSREAALRLRIAKIDKQLRQERHQTSLPDAMRNLGADILWQSWAMRTKEDLNTELARVLAQKSHVLAQMQIAYGRKNAVEALVKKETTNEKARLESAFEMSILDDLVQNKAVRKHVGGD